MPASILLSAKTDVLPSWYNALHFARTLTSVSAFLLIASESSSKAT
jgi:hypothetical protein